MRRFIIDKANGLQLLRLLDDEHWQVRRVATSYIGRFTYPRVLPALKRMFDDEDKRVREVARSWHDYLIRKKKKK
jgi:HEAT repeat protein